MEIAVSQYAGRKQKGEWNAGDKYGSLDIEHDHSGHLELPSSARMPDKSLHLSRSDSASPAERDVMSRDDMTSCHVTCRWGARDARLLAASSAVFSA